MNSTMTMLTYLTSTNSEPGNTFNGHSPSWLTADLVCGITIITLFLLTACFFYIFCKIHASGVRGTLTDPNNVRFGRSTKVPIEMHVVPNNTPNDSSSRKVSSNSVLHQPFQAKTSNRSRNDFSNIQIAYKLQMCLDNITPV